ncbi:hypothetical protein SH528x_003480 [Novipirellula sp. SH528]|uniref:hypothetical protein n=1 Tax=Novipirellula sp. SH528 TaxID=3454466 RepID=UPI003FA0E938
MTRIPFPARLGPKDEEIDARVTAERIRKHFPDAVVDWERGDEEIQRGIERLRDMQAPDFYIEAKRKSFGKVVYISVTDKSFSGFTAWFYASHIERDVGDCFDLYSEPSLNIPFLKVAAAQIADAAHFDFLFTTENDWGIDIRSVPERSDPFKFARQRLPEDNYGDLAIHPMNDWKSSLCSAVPRWFETAAFKSKEAMISKVGSIDAVASETIELLSQIDGIDRCWLVDIAAPFSNSFVVEHENWMSYVSLGGAPKGILA